MCFFIFLFFIVFSKIGMVLGGICCGMIADKWHCHRIVITLVCLSSLVSITVQPLVSVYYGNPETNTCPTSIVTDIQTADVNRNSNLTGVITCNNNTNLLTTQSNCTEARSKLNFLDKNYNSHTIYILMFLVNFCFAFSEGSSLAFIDSGTLRRSQLAIKNRTIHYGRQRMFSTVGAIFGIMVSNLSVDFFPQNNTITCYAGIFVAYGIYTVLYGVFTILSLSLIHI